MPKRFGINDVTPMKHILITGGTGGIGRQLAAAFIAAGHTVTIWARNQKDFDLLVQEVSLPDALHFDTVDVSNVQNVASASKKITQLDVLINAAGVLWPVGLFLECSLEQIHTALKTNLLGTLNTCYTLLPLLQRTKSSSRAKIVNFSGGGAGEGRKSHMAYSVSKTGVVRLTENIAIDYPSIDVNVISPGRHNTSLWQNETFDEHPTDWGSMNQLIEFFHFLISDSSNGMTGKFISIKDDWKNPAFIEHAKQNPDFLTLRRIDDFKFTAVTSTNK